MSLSSYKGSQIHICVHNILSSVSSVGIDSTHFNNPLWLPNYYDQNFMQFLWFLSLEMIEISEHRFVLTNKKKRKKANTNYSLKLVHVKLSPKPKINNSAKGKLFSLEYFHIRVLRINSLIKKLKLKNLKNIEVQRKILKSQQKRIPLENCRKKIW